MAIVLIAIGLLFTGVDFMVGSGISYPDFIQPTGLYHGIDIHPRIQQYVTQNILGHNLQVDILPDVIGCLLVLIGAFMFVKHIYSEYGNGMERVGSEVRDSRCILQ